MSDTAKRLCGPATLGTSAATLYTVPAATTTVVKSVTLSNATGSARTVNLSVGADAAGTRWLAAVGVPANGTNCIDTFLPLTTGEVLQGSCDAGSAVNVTIGGVETT